MKLSNLTYDDWNKMTKEEIEKIPIDDLRKEVFRLEYAYERNKMTREILLEPIRELTHRAYKSGTCITLGSDPKEEKQYKSCYYVYHKLILVKNIYKQRTMNPNFMSEKTSTNSDMNDDMNDDVWLEYCTPNKELNRKEINELRRKTNKINNKKNILLQNFNHQQQIIRQKMEEELYQCQKSYQYKLDELNDKEKKLKERLVKLE